MKQYLKEHTNPPVFLTSAIVVVAFVLWGVFAPANLNEIASNVNSFITTNFEWLYILSATFFVVFVLAVMFSRFGTIRLGPPESRPEYSNLAWFAMLFTAGMGIGLVFYAVSEPITHFTGPPIGEAGTQGAAQRAMNFTFFHWGLHPWAIYIVLGLALGYFAFRKGLPLRPSAAFYPLIGEWVHRWPGYIVDVLAVFGTLFGLATSLGLGGSQVGAGLNAVFGVENTPMLQIIVILAITAVAVVSVMLGIDKGIRNLSLINLWLAFVLMLFVFFFGNSLNLLNMLASNVGYYLQHLPELSFQTFPNNGNGTAQSWQSSWTLFYWGWWIAWSPFVGMFIARISYGRTIRNFIGGALFAPVGASFVWLSIFGNTALSRLLGSNDTTSGPLAEAGSNKAMFVMLDGLPVHTIVSTAASVLAIVVIVLFFATSSDSGSLVVDILTNGGDPNPKWQQRLFWAVSEGVIACVLLGAGAVTGADALSALQTASIVTGLPFAVVLILLCVSIVKALNQERPNLVAPREPSPMPGIRTSATRVVASTGAREVESGVSKDDQS
ncbi:MULTISPECIES: BCCT family transporter [Actinopolyspora]|uniref:Choline/glycine/proline betaine transport protein n=1 Tax=Actinopolyspora saharensis TaxID=995062 RepID=A0A1H1EGS2_9ACTN|nr:MULTISPECIES: BCCT family transporter [Actinopolyspora]NHD19070.1 BCCT family transporter [Actinopolyspora sp. BKK2]NHE78145.1 BCCT family transporter [Actinopolyspora sp. BKK1]SDQ87386.1 choline/glycine/proline betaine transport protein [Actinopolyspora saharensis]